MKSHTYNGQLRWQVSDSTIALKRRSRPTLFAIITLILISLTLSGCVAMTSASKPGKTGSNGATSGTLAASAASFTFGNIAIGAKNLQTLTLTNTGTATVLISKPRISGLGFSISTGPRSLSLDPGESHLFQIQFSPQRPGNHRGNIEVDSDASDSALSLPLNGNGIAGLSITMQPASQSVTAGQTATFDATAAGLGALTYQWKKNGVTIGAATFSTYTTPGTTSSDNGTMFSVAVSDSTSTVTSNPATLTVTTAPDAPTIAMHPASQTIIAGQPAVFTVSATGTAPLLYQWRKNGAAISGANSLTYGIPGTLASDNGASFSVTVSNTKGSVISNVATLTVNTPPAKTAQPTITGQPANQSITAGQTATFTVTATATPLTYQWTKNGTPISGANFPSYTTPVTTMADNGASFSVTVSNTRGSVTSNAALLTVNAPPAKTAQPTITAQPANQSITVGQTATFTVAATAAPLTYQWTKNGTPITGGNLPSYTTPAATMADNGASFSVTISNIAGIATSNAAALAITAAPVAPSIRVQPVSQTITAGQTATLSVSATGTANLTYQWNKNGIVITGATSPSYTAPATTVSDNGSAYTVIVSNSIGNITSNPATLTVTAATSLLNASTTALNFPSVNISSTSSLSVKFSNGGNSDVTVSNINIAGPGFAASGVPTGEILTPGQSTTLNVTYTPSTAGAGAGSVTVTSNATNSPTTITLSGTGVQPVSHSATFTWSASSSAVAAYNIYRSAVSGGPYTKLNSAPITMTQYVDSTVQAGKTYFNVITSVDSTNAESNFSNEVSATIPTN